MYTITLLLVSILLGSAMKYIWKTINVFQFIVFFMLWQISLSSYFKIILEAMKDLAFFEFLKNIALSSLDVLKCTNSNCIFEDAPVMVLAAACLGILLIIMVLLYVSGRYSAKTISFYMALRK